MTNAKNITNAMHASNKGKDQYDIFSDVRYVCNSATLISEALSKGSDVLQQPNGDILVNEIRTFTYRYTWDDKKGKLVRATEDSRRKRIGRLDLEHA